MDHGHVHTVETYAMESGRLLCLHWGKSGRNETHFVFERQKVIENLGTAELTR